MTGVRLKPKTEVEFQYDSLPFSENQVLLYISLGLRYLIAIWYKK